MMMVGVLALLCGVMGMAGLWLVAWRLWRSAVSTTAALPPLRELPVPTVEPAVPVAREHVDSGETTTFYSREELGRRPVERTEILPEEANFPTPVEDGARR